MNDNNDNQISNPRAQNKADPITEICDRRYSRRTLLKGGLAFGVVGLGDFMMLGIIALPQALELNRGIRQRASIGNLKTLIITPLPPSPPIAKPGHG